MAADDARLPVVSGNFDFDEGGCEVYEDLPEDDPSLNALRTVITELRERFAGARSGSRRPGKAFQYEIACAREAWLAVEFRWGRNVLSDYLRKCKQRGHIFVRLAETTSEYLGCPATKPGRPPISFLTLYIAKLLFVRESSSGWDERQAWDAAHCLEYFESIGTLTAEECMQVFARIGSVSALVKNFSEYMARAHQEEVHQTYWAADVQLPELIALGFHAQLAEK